MPLPSSGQISMSQVNTELGYSSTAQISLNDSAVRSLFQKTGSGTTISMSDGWGKSNCPAYGTYISGPACSGSTYGTTYADGSCGTYVVQVSYGTYASSSCQGTGDYYEYYYTGSCTGGNPDTYSTVIEYNSCTYCNGSGAYRNSGELVPGDTFCSGTTLYQNTYNGYGCNVSNSYVIVAYNSCACGGTDNHSFCDQVGEFCSGTDLHRYYWCNCSSTCETSSGDSEDCGGATPTNIACCC